MGKVLKVIEVLSESSKSYEDAIRNAVEDTGKSVRNIRSAYLNEQSVTIKDGKVDKFRVNVKITFEVDV
ncbi:dodecin family protein [Lewinella sp. 4G2]|uniref:dodecin family protein n=1 Tax=Lewinella sp. 4G2 TaxID=1803372 RepID=UPI0007B4F6C2|nr:dodecin family protein [Lewinella sp. 4G2]OAV44860.1 dodecin [Lewinella sp. 4G2]